MATNGREGLWERIKEFFWQSPADRKYEEQGGDDRVPQQDRHGHPHEEANAVAQAHGEPLPYPDEATASNDSEPKRDRGVRE